MSLRKIKSASLGGAAGAVVLASSLGAIVPAHALDALYAGGATFPEKVYRDIMDCYGSTSGGDLSTGLVGPPPAGPARCNGATPYNAGVELFYLGVGSGNGKKGLINAQADGHGDSSHFTDGLRTPDSPPVASSADFGPYFGTGAGSSWVPNTTDTGPFFPKVSFIGSDDPLVDSDISTFTANSATFGWGAIKQVPALLGAVAVPFKPATGVAWNEKGKKISGGSSQLDLTTNTWCGIWNGDISDWNDAAITADNAGISITGGVSKSINRVIRSDGSGTTFIEANGFINQCADPHSTHPVPVSWQTAQVWTVPSGGTCTVTSHNDLGISNNNWFINVKNSNNTGSVSGAASCAPLGSDGLMPNTIASAGNGGVKATINATGGSFGYASTDFVAPVDTTGPRSANLQTFHTFSAGSAPVFKAPTWQSAAAIATGAVVPSFTASTCTASAGGCATDPKAWGRAIPKPTSASAWPVGGFTFMQMATCYGTTANDLADLASTTAGSLGYLRWYYGSATENSGQVKASLNSNGFAQIPGPWLSGVKKLLFTNAPTKLGNPGQASTGCSGVSGALPGF